MPKVHAIFRLMKTPPKKPVLMSPANAHAALQPVRKLTPEEMFAQAKRDQSPERKALTRPLLSQSEPKKL